LWALCALWLLDATLRSVGDRLAREKAMTRICSHLECSLAGWAFTALAWILLATPSVHAQVPTQAPTPTPAPAPAETPKAPPHEPTAAELSHNETVGTALMRTFGGEEFEFRSTAEAMPEDKWGFRPVTTAKPTEPPAFGPTDLRTFAEQVKHVACSNFAFAAELDGKKPPAECDKGGPDPAKTRAQLLTYLRNSFAAMNASLNAVTSKNMYDPIEGPYGGPNTRLGIAGLAIWHVADHYGQLVLYLRMNDIVPPASRTNPPELKDYPAH
jgi:hypothetical protein